MTTIAKIFVVVNFLLSVFFVGVAATTLHKTNDYREMYETAVMEKNKLEEQKNNEIADLTVKNGELERDRGSLKTERDNLDAERQRLAQERDQLRNDIREINGTKDKLSSTVENLRSQLAEAQNYVQSLQNDKDDSSTKMNDAMEAQRVAENEQRRLDDQLQDEKSLTANLQKKIEDLQKELDEWSLINDYWMNEKNVNLRSEVAAAIPPINGRVQNVNGDLGFVVLSVGANDNVKVGYTFVVSRGNQYIGDVTVDQVEDDTSSARITFVKRGAEIHVSDEVTTKL